MPNSKQIVYLSQSQYAELIANGTITVDGVTVTYDENDIYVTPQAEPVTDVRINGTSIAANGVANLPVATLNTVGLVKPQTSYGIGLNANGDGGLRVDGADSTIIKNGTGNGSLNKPIIPYRQHESVFYGLAKVAGHDEKDSTESVGTYTPEAKGAIQQMLGVSDLIATSENDLTASKAYAVGDVFTANGKLYKATAAIAADAAIIPTVEGEEVAGANCEETSVGDGFPHDVQVNGVSVVSEGVANIPVVQAHGQIGAVRTNLRGLTYHNDPYDNTLPKVLGIDGINTNDCKVGSSYWKVAVPAYEGPFTFYGLATAAGARENNSALPYGTYTDNAKASIKSMLGIVDGSTGTVDITGATPTINAVENTRYVCGEVTSLSFTPPSSGISIVRFTSGSTVTVLTIPSTVKFPEWFDPTALETNTIYEICVTDGEFGAVMSWAL